MPHCALLVERFQPLPAGLPLYFHWKNGWMTFSSVSTAVATRTFVSSGSFEAASISERNWAYRASSPGSGSTVARTSLNWSKNFSGITHFVSPPPPLSFEGGAGRFGFVAQSIVFLFPVKSFNG